MVLIQEWWGLVPHIKDVAERLAAEGFTVLAPDLYHGAVHDRARRRRQADDGAQHFDCGQGPLGCGRPCCRSARGTPRSAWWGTAWVAVSPSSSRASVPMPSRVRVPFYGLIPWPDAQPDWSKLSATVARRVRRARRVLLPGRRPRLEAELRAFGKDANFHVYPDAEHAFFNDTRPEVHDAESVGHGVATRTSTSSTTASGDLGRGRGRRRRRPVPLVGSRDGPSHRRFRGPRTTARPRSPSTWRRRRCGTPVAWSTTAGP